MEKGWSYISKSVCVVLAAIGWHSLVFYVDNKIIKLVGLMFWRGPAMKFHASFNGVDRQFDERDHGA